MSTVVRSTRPNPGEACDTNGRDGKIRASADQDFFQPADEFDCAQGFALAVGRGKSAQVEDGIADDLAGAVEGYVAAAVAFEKLHSALGEEFTQSDYVSGFRVAAQGDDRRVFEQEQDVADLFFFS